MIPEDAIMYLSDSDLEGLGIQHSDVAKPWCLMGWIEDALIAKFEGRLQTSPKTVEEEFCQAMGGAMLQGF